MLKKKGFLRAEPMRMMDMPMFRSVMDSVPLGMVFLLAAPGSVNRANRYFLELPRYHREYILAYLRDRFLTKPGPYSNRAFVEEIEIIGRDGSKFIYRIISYPVLEEDYVLFVHALSSPSILTQNRQENIFFDQLSEMVAEIAHEIGNPLTAMNTMLQVLQQNLSEWDENKIKDYIGRSISEIQRLNDFLNRIRGISGETALDIRPVGLRMLLRRVFERNQECFRKGSVTFHNLVKPGICVFVDEGALFRILLNLMNNSLNFLKPGQEISVSLSNIQKDFVTMVYTNNGPPIPGADLERIFSPFYTTRQAGEGIGLAISLKLMTRMGGLIKATPPEEGKDGVRFVLYLPRGECP